MRTLMMVLCMVAAPLLAHAQDVTVKHSVDRDTVGVGESLTYTIEVSASGNLRAGNPEPPKLPGLQVMSAGTSDNLSIVNGEVSATRVYQFALIPQKAGEFRLPAAKVDIGGVVKKADGEVTFRAVDNGGGGAAAPQPAQPQQPDEEEDDGSGQAPAPAAPAAPPPAPKGVDRSLFVRAHVSKKQVFQGEPLVYTSSLFSVNPFMNGTGIKEDASFPGFVVEQQQADNRARQVREGSQLYFRADVSRRILVPTKSGAATIKPETLQVALRVRQQRRGDPNDPFGGHFEDPFEAFFARPQIRYVTAPPLDVKVVPLPEDGKPAEFSGAVGTEFMVTSSLDKESLKENEVLTLRFTVRGKGDVRGIQEPKLEVANDFKLFPAKATPKLEVNAEGLLGTKVFEFVLAPRGTGEKVIPGVKFSYFDTDQKKYVTKSTQAVKITVLPGEKEERVAGVGAAPSTREDIKVLGRDLNFIKEDPSGLATAAVLVRQPIFWVSNLLPIALVFLVWLWRLKRHRLESDVAWARRSRAYSAARKQLGELRSGAGSMDARTFYAKLDQLLLEFVAGKLNRSAAGITQEEVLQGLLGAAVEERLAKRFTELVLRCEEMRYAPVGGGEAAARAGDLDASDQLLAELEGVLA